MKRYGVIIAARTGSSRLPGKVLLPLQEVPLIVFLIRRLQSSLMAERIVLATTDSPGDDPLAAAAESEGLSVFRGDTNDVVKRYVEAASMYDMEYVVRVTGDCPFTSGKTLDYCLKKCDDWGPFDLASTKSYFPLGIDYEIYNAKKMQDLHESGKLSIEEREHLTLHMYNQRDKFDIKNIIPPDKWVCKKHSFTVDTEHDYKRALQLVSSFQSIDFMLEELITEAQK